MHPGKRPSAIAGTVVMSCAAAGLGGGLWTSVHHGIGVGLPVRGDHPGSAPGSPEFLAIGLWGAGAVLGTTLAVWLARTARAQDFATFARVAAVIAVAAALAEVLLTGNSPRHLVTGVVVVKVAAMVPALCAAGYGVLAAAWRLARRARFGEVTPAPVAAAAAHDQADRWKKGYDVPGVERDRTGFCLSGGGVRAATISLGVLQSMWPRLLRARYLVAVSGGGFTAGALQQALVPRGGTHPLAAPTRPLFAHGSAEEDHVRRNISYLADSVPETLTALAVLARGLLLSLFVLFAPAFVLGAVAGWAYRAVPVAVVPIVPGAPDVLPGVLVGFGLLALPALVVSLVGRWSRPARGREEGRRLADWVEGVRWPLRRLADRLALLAVVVAVVTVAVPALVWLAGRLPTGDTGLGVVGSVGSVLLSYVTTLAAVLWRNRTRIAGGGVPAAVPNSFLQRVLVVLTITVLALAWLLVFALAAGAGGTPATLWWALGFAVVAGIVGGLLDQTSLSLHPFYRERVACAFAMRPVPEGRGTAAVPYSSTEPTTLSTYGRKADGFPEVIFAAAANLSGERRTPPGLNAVSFTMSGHWVGGPDVGWVRADELQDVVPPRFGRDLTVQGAVAVSGAAFASAMGRSSRWFQVLLAVSGARLGAWLPNPAFVQEAPPAGARDRWTYPGLPRARRLPYLWREVFGIHSHRDRLLHVTDGGHYDNLGLVELLRRGCTTIYCVDASADPPPTAGTLTQALTLARQELGVSVELHEPWTAEPGTGAPRPEDPLSALNSRLAKTPVLTGTITYPPESGLPEGRRTGRLVVLKALLWPELPYEVLSYAAHHPEFPHDATSDQFFDDGKYTAYTELGRRLGRLAERPEQPAGTAESTVE
jgi:hypothetical protein